ncbi:MAG TPA: acetate kinase, partial [Flavobacteriaceae bacterium]|nr:acetate kinase [Flavobacteriaceae bacterium]
MQILVLNSGSSSLKFQLFSMPDETILCSGIIERIGFEDAKFKFNTQNETIELETPILNHNVGLKLLAKQLLDKETGILTSPDDISVVGHRVVHGGKHFSKTTEITEAVKEKIKALARLAPLHNPANLEGIEVAEKVFPNAKQVAVFDTAFHQTIPEYAYKYAI